MLKVVDDRRREIFFARPPRRIVSLVPSDTETLFALGCGDRVVGRTLYCVEPAGSVAAITACGGTKDVDVEAVAALAPDLVIANQEENTRAHIEALAAQNICVFVAFPRRAADGVAHMARLARILGVEKEPAAQHLLRTGYRQLRAAIAESAAAPARAVFVPIWPDPLMTFSGGTYGSDLLALCGARNVFANRQRRYPLAADLGRRSSVPAGERDTRYPRVTRDEVRQRQPQLVLLPDEPYGFSAADAERFADLGGPVALCSGKDLFWYGARTSDALVRLRALVRSIP
jgi:ABC-type Fe3+-hydroxamate transport system substrate-binding protein